MEFETVKRYIEKVKNREKFKEIEEFTHMTTLDENKDMYANIEYYVSMFMPRHDCKEFFQPDYELFMSFLTNYLNNQPPKLVYDEKGRIDLTKTLHIVRPAKFCGRGSFIANNIMLTDGTIYFCKIPINQASKTRIREKNIIYVPIIAAQIAKKIGVEAADITIGTAKNGVPRLLSKNFLNTNQELIVYTEDTAEILISEQLRELEKALKLRKFPESEIERTKLEFLKQEFVAKLIDLRDQTAENSPIIVETDEKGQKHVKMAPMYDLDFSLGTSNILARKCDNGKEDIASLIEQYKDYPGFREFAEKSIQTLDISQLFDDIYRSTGLVEFKDLKNNPDMMKFIDFVNQNIRKSERNYKKNK